MNSGANERAVIGTTNAPADDPPLFYADLHVFGGDCESLREFSE